MCDLQNIALYANVPKLRSVCLVSESALNRERVLKWSRMSLLQQPWGDNVQVHPNTFSARRDAMFLQNVVFVPESQIYHNSTGAFLSGSVYGMRQKRLLGNKQMFSLFLWWRDFKITHSSPAVPAWPWGLMWDWGNCTATLNGFSLH